MKRKAVLFGFSLLHLALPDREVSRSERRRLAQLPPLSSGFSDKLEEYMLDQFPLREQLRTVNSLVRLYGLGQADIHSIYLQGGGAFRMDGPLQEKQVRHAAAVFSAVQETYFPSLPSHYVIVPDKNAKAETSRPRLDTETLRGIVREALPGMTEIDIWDLLSADDYYKTDPHWRQERLLPVAAAICEALGADAPGTFTKKTLSSPRPERCTDWTTPVGEDPWDARKYATDDECKRWLGMVYDRAQEATAEEICEWLETSPWGRDYLQCDNDQPDHQVSIMRFEGGLTGTFTMTAFEQGRHIEVYGTKGKIRAGAFYKENGPGEITVTPHFGGKTRVVELEELAGGYQGHGGGDWGLVEALYDDMLTVPSPADMTTSIEESAHSHVMAFATEHARLTGQVVDVAEFERRVMRGELDY